ncbi:MAG: N-acetylmuramoyl-L-alanine amidase [Tissierella sp.]|nr:N-acetylmuramoyl-L-alanine amidase [Tissierella sp.]
MAKVFLDPGHGGEDPGAVGNGLQEKDINLSVALKIGEILKRHNIEVEYSRTTDVFIDLTPRANMANKRKADIFVSIHCNSFDDASAQGLETFHYTGSSKGKILATDIQNSLIDSKVYTKNRGVKSANFTVIAETTMPAALVELAFISNVEDANILRNEQDELAIAVAKGVLKNLGLTYVEKNEIDAPSPWAADAWDWAKENGITDGSRPKEFATREEIITMIYRAKEVK